MRPLRIVQALDSSRPLRLMTLAAVLLVALALRLYGIDWDQGGFFHPDERFIILLKLPEIGTLWHFDLARALDPATSPWNPRWFAYGSLPFYVLRAVADVVSAVIGPIRLEDTRFIGRGMTALADVGNVAMVYWLGNRLYGWRTGMLAAVLLALAVLHIQLSHFAAFDVLLTLWVLLGIAGGALAIERPGWASVLVCGAGLGFGLATKITILFLLAPIAAGYVLYAVTQPDGRLSWWADRDRATRATICLIGTAALAALLLLVTQPYMLLDFKTFQHDTSEQTQMALRLADLPYTRQFIGTLPYVYQIVQTSAWGLWWPLGIAAWLGVLFAAWRAGIYRQRADLLLLSWVVPYFLVTGAFPVKFLRYMLPVMPVLVLLGARMLVAWQSAAVRAAQWRPATVGQPGLRTAPAYAVFGPPPAALRFDALPPLVIALVVAATACYALAFTNIYRQAHPAQRMTDWFHANVAPGTPQLQEHWDEGLPRMPEYPKADLPLYDPDSPAKAALLAQRMATSEYIILFSNRLYGTIPTLPERYPMAGEYYRLLFSGQLGYQLAHYEAANPQLGALTWVSDTFSRPNLPRVVDPAPPGSVVVQRAFADETFSVYDHPLVMAFKNDHTKSEADLRAMLTAALPPPGAGVRPEGLLMSPALKAEQQAGGTWSRIFDRDSLQNQWAIPAWLLAVEALFLLALPLSLWLFRAFPDRGAGLAPILGLVLVGWLVWLAAALQALPFGRSSILVAMAVFGGTTLVGLSRWWPAVLAGVRTGWRGMLLAHLVFLLAFAADTYVRSLNPDLWHPARGGEKPMDFAYFNAIIRSTFMPPYDPWYAGGQMNYYYFGQFLAAVPTKLTGILPEVAYNLVIPTLFACLVAGSFSIGGALVTAAGGVAGAGRRLWRLTDRITTQPEIADTPGPLQRWWWAAGLTVAFGVALAGNLDGAVQLIDRLQQVSQVSVPSNIPGVSGLVGVAAGIFRVLVGGARLQPIDYWRSRGMGDMDRTFLDPGTPNPSPTIVEFPFFTYLFADLHAHLIALPIGVLAVGLALRVVLGGERDRWWPRLGWLALAGVVMGALRWTNSWDYPTYLAVAAAALLAGEVWRSGQGFWVALVTAVLQTAVLALVSIVAFLPFQRSYELFYGGGLVQTPEHTSLGLYLRIHGLFLAGIASLVVYQAWRWLSALGVPRALWLLVTARSLGRTLSHLRRLALGAYTALLVGLLALVFVPLTWLVIAQVAGGAAPFILLLLLAVVALGLAELGDRREDRLYLFMLLMMGLGLALTLFVEVAKLDIPGEVQRMNNVFKLYLQVWVVFAVAGTYGFWWVLARVLRHASPLPFRSQAWLWGMGALAAGAMVYPIMATPVRLNDRFARSEPTLDGAAYMATAAYQDQPGPLELGWDYQAIRWLEDNVQGSPVVLEAQVPIYRWGSRISVYTGLPTVLGWDWHQTQQRWDYRPYLEQRKTDVALMYASPNPADTLAGLRKYGVKYVYVGPLERLYYPREGLNKFGQMAAQGQLRQVYANPQVTIYEVVG